MEAKERRDVKGIKDVKLLIDLVRGGKLRKRHAREERNEKSEHKEGAMEEIQNEMTKKRKTRNN